METRAGIRQRLFNFLFRKRAQRGSAGMLAILVASVCAILAFVFIQAALPNTNSMIVQLEASGYVVFAAGEYSTLTSSIASLQEVEDEIDDATQHTTFIYPGDTNLTCTLTAHATANTWSAWAEITDSGANTLSSLFAADVGHITSMVIETISDDNAIYMIEIAYGADKTLITSGRFAGGTKFQAPNMQKRFWADPLPAGETVYYRMKTATGVADTATIHLRYHLE